MSKYVHLARQATSYGVIGGIQVGVDWLRFVGLSAWGLGAVGANVCGRISGALFGYTMNGLVTFRDPGRERLGWIRLGRFALLWGLTTCLSTLAIRYLVGIFGLHWVWLLKPVIDAALAIFSFLVSRHWIYK